MDDGYNLEGRCLIFNRAEVDHEILTSASATLGFSVFVLLRISGGRLTVPAEVTTSSVFALKVG